MFLQFTKEPQNYKYKQASSDSAVHQEVLKIERLQNRKSLEVEQANNFKSLNMSAPLILMMNHITQVKRSLKEDQLVQNGNWNIYCQTQ